MEDFLYRARPWVVTLVQHNWPIMIYSVALVWAALRAYLHPSRTSLLLLYGVAMLALAFEYQKHVSNVVENTLDYLFKRNPGALAAGQALLLDALPVALHLMGLALVVLSLARTWRREPRVASTRVRRSEPSDP